MFETTVARIARLKEQISLLETEVEDLYESLGDLEVRDYPAGEYILRVTPNRRFDAATAKKALTEDEYAGILKLTPNSALAKATLDDDLYRACQRDYGLRRTIVRVEDEDD